MVVNILMWFRIRLIRGTRRLRDKGGELVLGGTGILRKMHKVADFQNVQGVVYIMVMNMCFMEWSKWGDEKEVKVLDHLEASFSLGECNVSKLGCYDPFAKESDKNSLGQEFYNAAESDFSGDELDGNQDHTKLSFSNLAFCSFWKKFGNMAYQLQMQENTKINSFGWQKFAIALSNTLFFVFYWNLKLCIGGLEVNLTKVMRCLVLPEVHDVKKLFGADTRQEPSAWEKVSDSCDHLGSCGIICVKTDDSILFRRALYNVLAFCFAAYHQLGARLAIRGTVRLTNERFNTFVGAVSSAHTVCEMSSLHIVVPEQLKECNNPSGKVRLNTLFSHQYKEMQLGYEGLAVTAADLEMKLCLRFDELFQQLPFAPTNSIRIQFRQNSS